MALPASLLGIEVPGEQDLTIRQGDTFNFPFTVQVGGAAVDLTSITPACKIRDGIGGTVLVTASAVITTPLAGLVTVSLTKAQTAALAAPVGSTADQRIVAIGYYDVDLTDGTSTRTIIGGRVNLYREVTV